MQDSDLAGLPESSILLSTGLWISQSPGAECVGGLCLLLRMGQAWELNLPAPAHWTGGYAVSLWGRLEHPVDSKPSAFLKALELALTDLPPAPVCDFPRPTNAPSESDWMWKPEARPFLPTCEVWSRVRRYQPGWKLDQNRRLAPLTRMDETTLIWKAFQPEPTSQGERDRLLAWDQAARFFRPAQARGESR